MNTPTLTVDCGKTPPRAHTLDEDFEHFLTYSGLSQEPYGVRLKLRRAFEANWRAPFNYGQRNGRTPVFWLEPGGAVHTSSARGAGIAVPLYLHPVSADEIAEMIGKSHRNPLIP